jgi:hypothetical protein
MEMAGRYTQHSCGNLISVKGKLRPKFDVVTFSVSDLNVLRFDEVPVLSLIFNMNSSKS